MGSEDQKEETTEKSQEVTKIVTNIYTWELYNYSKAITDQLYERKDFIKVRFNDSMHYIMKKSILSIEVSPFTEEQPEHQEQEDESTVQEIQSIQERRPSWFRNIFIR